MKKLSLLLVIAFMTTLFLDSCTVQKRYHRKGFNVNWNHTSIGSKKDKSKISYEAIDEEITEVKESRASENVIENETSDISKESSFDFASSTDEVAILASLPTENKLNTNKRIEIEAEKKSTFDAQKKSIKKNIEVRKKKIVESKNTSNKTMDGLTIILIILCFILPPLAVAIATDLDLKPIIWNLILCFLGVIPGIIHALIHVSRNR